MKKRLLSWLMVLTLCLTLLPTAAFAAADTGEPETEQTETAPILQDEPEQPAQEPEQEDSPAQPAPQAAENGIAVYSGHTHYLCGSSTCNGVGGHSCEEKEFEPWDSTTMLPSTVGNYYLTNNVELSTAWLPVDGVVLCLNGKTIMVNANDYTIMIANGITFTLTDCQNDKGSITHVAGKTGHGVQVSEGTFNMYGGSITGNTGSAPGGGGVHVYYKQGNTFNMYGGSITKNTAAYGGGVYVNCNFYNKTYGTFNMYGGSIAENSATKNGGGVFVSSDNDTNTAGEMTIGGGATITDNKKSDGTVNNVYLYYEGTYGPTITVNNDFTGSIGLAVDANNTGKKLVSGIDKGTITPDDPKYTINANGQAASNDPGVDPTAHIGGDHCICGVSHGSGVGDHKTKELKAWTGVDSLDKITSAGRYYLKNDVKLDSTWETPAADIVLCLNGKTITGPNLAGSDGYVIRVASDAVFTITDCNDGDEQGKITHASGANGSGVDAVGTFNMYGGIITGNTRGDGIASGVHVATTSNSIFNMYGGSITGNTAEYGGGVYVESYGTFHMYGGTIENNTATNNDGGVYVGGSATFTVSGDAKITNNTVNGKSNNVYLPKGKTIVIDSMYGLKNSAQLGVTTEAEPQDNSPVIIVTGAAAGTDYRSIVKSDNSAYKVVRDSSDETKLVLAVNAHRHYLCGSGACSGVGGHSENGETSFTAWNDSTSLPTTAGSYYLTGPVTLSRMWEPADGTVLCLNGQTVTANHSESAAIKVAEEVDFTLTDCQDEQGKVTHAEGMNGKGVWVENALNAGEGFVMYGGSISGNTATSFGSGVQVGSKRVFTMYGGTISGNTAQRVGTSGGYGGGVYISWNANNGSGTFNMYGGSIADNEAEHFGGGVYVNRESTFTMSGDASITGNTAGFDGGGVYMFRDNASTFHMSGNAKITGNSCGGSYVGGGVYVGTSGDFTISGNVQVTDNHKADSGLKNNVSLYTPDYKENTRARIKIDGLTDQAKIGVFLLSIDKDRTVATGAQSADKNRFTSDWDDCYIAYEDGTLLLKEGTPITAIEVPAANTGLTYNGEEQTGVASGVGYTLTGNTATNAGSYTATATLEDGYTWSDGGTDAKTISWSIAKKTPELSDFVMSKPTDLVYDGAEKPATVTLKSGLTGCDFTVNYYMDGVLQAAGELPKNVGHYTFGVTVSESTNFTASQYEILDTDWGFDITKANLTGIIAAGYTGVYDGQEHGITVTGAPEGTTIRYNSVDTPAIGYDNDHWGSSSLNYTDEGTYTVYYRVYGANYNTFGGSAVVTISKADPEEPADLVGRLDQPLSTVELPEGWTWVDPTIVMATLGEQHFYANYAGSKNFNAKQNMSVTVTVTDKTEAGVSISAPTVKTYGDAEFTVTAAAAHTGDAALWSWRSSNPSVLKIIDLHGAAATIEVIGAGKATLTAIYNSTTTYGEDTAEITVDKATVTVTAKNQSIYVGGTAPDLSSPAKGTHYTVSGLVGDDALTGTLTMQYQKNGEAITPDTTKAGTYDIVISGVMEPAGGNYNAIVLNNGTLTIENRSSGSGGSYTPTYPVSAPSKTENGSVSSNVKNAAKGSTVTITVKPEAGFKLAALTVTDKDGNVLTLTDKGDGTYTFTMPAGEVEVNAVFAEEVETSPFTDVSTKAYYYEAVKWAADQGITGGIGNNLFGSNQPCTRAQIVTFLWRAAGSPEPKGDAAGMTDVAAGSYYEKAVAWAIENGITTGTGEGKFSPDATCTRAQAVTFLARALNAKASGKAEFSDVPVDSYFADAVAWAASNGVTEGVGNSLFAPDNDCTRGQIVTFLFRAYNK